MTVQSPATRTPERSDSATSSSNLHIGALIFGGASTILVALRLLSVARFNPETAYGILQASGTATVLIGTVISVIPSIAIIAASCLAVREIFKNVHPSGAAPAVGAADAAGTAPAADPVAKFATWASIFTLALIAALTIPLRYAYAIAVAAVLILIVWLLRQRIVDHLNRTEGTITAALVAFFAASLLMLGVVLSPPWMPAEHLTFNNAPPVTGYILDHSSDGLTVMQISSREILYYDPTALTGQSMCSNVPANDFPVMAFPPFSGILGFYRYTHC